jgi:hypothetical protein
MASIAWTLRSRHRRFRCILERRKYPLQSRNVSFLLRRHDVRRRRIRRCMLLHEYDETLGRTADKVGAKICLKRRWRLRKVQAMEAMSL